MWGEVKGKRYHSRVRSEGRVGADGRGIDVGGTRVATRHSPDNDRGLEKQAVEGMMATFSGKAEATQAASELRC